MKIVFFLATIYHFICDGLLLKSFHRCQKYRTNDLQMSIEQLGVVTMYKKVGCPYCAKATDLLEGKYSLKINYVDIESPEREEILYQMKTFSGGKSTVPQIFFNAEHLGGNSDIQELEITGKLTDKVTMVRTTPITMMQPNWYHPWY